MDVQEQRRSRVGFLGVPSWVCLHRDSASSVVIPLLALPPLQAEMVPINQKTVLYVTPVLCIELIAVC